MREKDKQRAREKERVTRRGVTAVPDRRDRERVRNASRRMHEFDDYMNDAPEDSRRKEQERGAPREGHEPERGSGAEEKRPAQGEVRRAEGRRENAKRVLEPTAEKAPVSEGNPERFLHQIVPYVMFWVALFAGVSFLLRDIFNMDGSAGAFGTWLANVLCGLLGVAAYLLPAMLVALSLKWRRFVKEGQLAKRLMLSFAFMLLLSSIIHVFTDPDNVRKVTALSVLYAGGIAGSGGGVLGGFFGEWIGFFLRKIGTGLLMIPLLLIVSIYLVGLTPEELWQRAESKWRIMKQQRRESRLQKEERASVKHAEKEEERALREQEKEEKQERREQEKKEGKDSSEWREPRPLKRSGGTMYRFREDEPDVDAEPPRHKPREDRDEEVEAPEEPREERTEPRRRSNIDAAFGGGVEDYGRDEPMTAPTGSGNELLDIPDDEPEITEPSEGARAILDQAGQGGNPGDRIETILNDMFATPAPTPSPQTPKEDNANYYAPFALPVRPEPRRDKGDAAAASRIVITPKDRSVAPAEPTGERYGTVPPSAVDAPRGEERLGSPASQGGTYQPAARPAPRDEYAYGERKKPNDPAAYRWDVPARHDDTPAAAEPRYGVTPSTEQPYRTPAAAEPRYGSATPTEQPYRTPAAAEPCYGSTTPTEQPYRTPAAAEPRYGSTTPTEQPYRTPAAAEPRYGVTPSTEQPYRTPAAAEPRYGVTPPAARPDGDHTFGFAEDPLDGVSEVSDVTVTRDAPQQPYDDPDVDTFSEFLGELEDDLDGEGNVSEIVTPTPAVRATYEPVPPLSAQTPSRTATPFAPRGEEEAPRFAAPTEQPRRTPAEGTPRYERPVPAEPARAPEAPRYGTAVPVLSRTEPVEDKPPVQPPVIEEYKFPPITLLNEDKNEKNRDFYEEIEDTKEVLRSTLASFNIHIQDEVACSHGPSITRYELRPVAGTSVRSVTNRIDDISLNLAASVRIEAPIPGKPAIGIEVPNKVRETVYMRTMLESETFKRSTKPFEVPLGLDVGGGVRLCDITAMPHLLVAGTTGSGKSVCINSILVSLLYKTSPEDLRLILIDPKQIEFAPYEHIPHLYMPIVTDMQRAAGALACAVQEMERRFSLIKDVGVRDIKAYNEAVKNDPDREHLPRIIIVIDEFADLKMSCTNNDPENFTCRIAQKARAAGIHLIIGTQRPSVDVITGKLKTNIASRIAFMVKQQVDSRTILDVNGAESLTGKGDMLYMPANSQDKQPCRIQGAFVSDGELERVVSYVRDHNPPVQYNREFMNQIEIEMAKAANTGRKNGEDIEEEDADGSEDPKFLEAVELAVETQKIATSLLQRRLGVGYGRAAKIIDRMEDLGLVSAPDGNKARKVLPAAQGYLNHMAAEGDEGDVDDFGDYT